MISSVLGNYIAKRGVLSPVKTFNRTTVERKCAHGLKVNVYPSFWEVGNRESPAQLVEGMCKDIIIMCLHGALSSIPFNLLCNMTTFRKSILTNPGVEGVCNDTLCLHGALCSFPFTTMFLLPSSPLI